MARRALKDTYMYEAVSPDAIVRRAVFAGQFVPDHYVTGEDSDESALEDGVDGPKMVGFGAAAGFGAAPHENKHATVPATPTKASKAKAAD